MPTAESKAVQQLTENTSPIKTDFMPISDDVALPGHQVEKISLATLRKHMVPWNIEDYGASVGSSDNLAAINSTITAAEALGGTVHIPVGTYVVAPSGTDTLITAKSGVTLEGTGPASVIKVKDDCGDYRTLIGSTSTVTNFTLQNLRIDQNAAGNTICNISITDGTQQFAFRLAGANTTDIKVFNCVFDTCTGVNTVLVNSTGGKRVDVSHNFFRFKKGETSSLYYDNTAIYLECQSIRIIGNHILSDDYDDFPGAGFEIHGCQAVATGNLVDGFQVGCWVVTPFNSADQLTNGNIVVSGNSFARVASGIGLIAVTSASNSVPVMRNVTVSNNSIGILQGTTGHDAVLSFGISLRNADGTMEALTVQGNTVTFEADTRSDSTRHEAALDSNGIWTGIYLGGNDGLTDVLVEGNTVINAPYIGIAFGYPDAGCTMKRVVCRRNRLIDPGCNTNADPSYLRVGLEITGVHTDCQIEDNEHIDTSTTGTPKGLSRIRCYPSAAPVRSFLRGNRATLAGSGALIDTFVDATAFLGGPLSGQEIVTYAAGVTPDPFKPATKIITLTGNISIAAPEVSLKGQQMTFIFIQDGTGTWTVTWNAAYKTTWAIDTGANQKSCVTFEYDGSNWVQQGLASTVFSMVEAEDLDAGVNDIVKLRYKNALNSGFKISMLAESVETAYIKHELTETGGANGYMAFATHFGGGGGDGTVERMRIKGNGNVGIAETDPDYKLDVNGAIGFAPGASVTPVDNGDVVIEATDNTTLTFKLKGSDGTVRSGTVTLS